MTACTDIADYEWLTGDEACGLLNELGELAAPLHVTVERLRRSTSPERTHLLIEQAELRRRAAAKFTHAARMFFTPLGLEQATDEWVAAYKAQRFAQRAGLSLSNAPAILADLCCGIGGDLIALAGQGTVIGIDIDRTATLLAAANCDAVLRTAEIAFHNADVADFDLDGVTAWHIDPDRRPGTRHGGGVRRRRTTSLDAFRPDRAAIDRMIVRVPHAAVKLAPATVVPREWAVHCELEWISRDRQCRQLVAWHGNLAHTPGQRRATILASRGVPASGACTRSLIGAPNQPIPIASHSDRYVFDTDPAIRAARLTGALAAEYDLAALRTGPTYLTGPVPTADAALACFEVCDVLPFEPRSLVRHLRERNIGQLEIKKRGVDIDPETLRRELKLSGSNAATLLVTRISGRPTAILARRR